MTLHPTEFLRRQSSRRPLTTYLLAGSFSVLSVLSFAFSGNRGSLTEVSVADYANAPSIISLFQKSSGILQSQFTGRYRTLTPDQQGVITYVASERTSYLYSLEGVEQASFEGDFQAFTRDQQGLFTYDTGRTRLYTLEGDRQAIFEGAPVSLTPNEQSILVVDDFHGNARAVGGIFSTRLYRLDGTEQAMFPGNFTAFTPNGEALIATCIGDTGLVSRLYSLTGEQKATFKGRFVAFTPDGQKLVTTSYDKTRIYYLDGRLQSVLLGRVELASASHLRTGLSDISHSGGLTPDGTGVVTTSNEASWLYNFGGERQQTFRGRFWNFTPDGTGLITYAFGQQSWIYNLDGTLQRSVEGNLLRFTPDAQALIVQHRSQSHLYTLAGDLQTTFPGRFSALTPDATGIITNGSGAEGYQSWLYRLDESGDPIVLEGILLGYAVNQERIITSSDGVYGPYKVYRFDGILDTTSSIWPRPTPDGLGFVTVVRGRSQIHQLDGSVSQTFPGTFQSFTDNGQNLITYSASENQSRLYRFNGR